MTSPRCPHCNQLLPSPRAPEPCERCGRPRPPTNRRFCGQKCALLTYADEHGQIVWDKIVQRCTNPKNKAFAHYGARGIEVRISRQRFSALWRQAAKCDLSQEPFTGGRGPASKTVDRIDPNGHYEERNIRFIQRRYNSARVRISHLDH